MSYHQLLGKGHIAPRNLIEELLFGTSIGTITSECISESMTQRMLDAFNEEESSETELNIESHSDEHNLCMICFENTCNIINLLCCKNKIVCGTCQNKSNNPEICYFCRQTIKI